MPKPRPRTPALLPSSPVQVYLSELSPGSRRTMRFALRTAAEFLGGTEDVERFPWHKIRVEQMAALRAELTGWLPPHPHQQDQGRGAGECAVPTTTPSHLSPCAASANRSTRVTSWSTSLGPRR